MQRSLPGSPGRLWLLGALTITALLLLSANSFAQKSQIDKKITDTMWVMQPDAVGFTESVDQYPSEFEGLNLEELSHPVYRPQVAHHPPRQLTGRCS